MLAPREEEEGWPGRPGADAGPRKKGPCGRLTPSLTLPPAHWIQILEVLCLVCPPHQGTVDVNIEFSTMRVFVGAKATKENPSLGGSPLPGN